MQIIHDKSQLKEIVNSYKKSGTAIAFAPTMGALHKGHLSLTKIARSKAQKVFVSIFVNPLQFGANEDFDRYPRDIEKDSQMLAAEGVDYLYFPTAQNMYPDGFSTNISLGEITKILCGKFRVGHFDGVATVVAKLLNQVTPDYAIFGEKDYQQLCVIKKLVKELDIETQIIGAPIIREQDGLAMSSRNQYLSADERKTAAKLYAVLNDTKTAILAGSDINNSLSAARERLIKSGFDKIDYIELRYNDSLLPATSHENTRLIAALWLGKTRLIDNLEV